MPDFPPRFLPVRQNGRWGYIDQRGQVVLPCDYDLTSRFSEGYAVIRRSFPGELTIIDASLRTVGTFEETDYFGDIYDGVFFFQSKQHAQQRFGYATPLGQVVIAPEFEFARDFCGGLSIVELNGAYGAINRLGELVIPPRYRTLWSFGDGEPLTVFQRGDVGADQSSSRASESRWLFGLLDRRGNVVVEAKYTALGNPSRGIIPAAVGDRSSIKFGLLSAQGEWMVEPCYDDCGSFSGDLCPAAIDGRWGMIDRSGRWVIKPLYPNVHEGVENGLVGVYVGGGRDVGGDLTGGKYGFINLEGEIVIEPQFDDVSPFHEGVAEVRMHANDDDYEIGYIDTAGNYIWRPTM